MSDEGGDPACWAHLAELSVQVVPTLAFMADVYRLPRAGGSSSERFRAFSAAAGAGRPIQGYDPMTTKAVLPTIEALLAIDAEARLAALAAPVLERLGVEGEQHLHITVAAPQRWSDRFVTELEHRLLGHDPDTLLWWFDQLVTETAFDAAAVAQAVRLARFRAHGPPANLAAAVEQEGEALAAAGATGRLDPTAAEVLDARADDPTLSTMVAFLYGDATARAMDFTPLGLGNQVGQDHAIAVAAARHSGRE